MIKLPEIAMDYDDKPNLKDGFKEIFSWKQIKDLFVENTVDEIKKTILMYLIVFIVHLIMLGYQ